MDVHPYLMNADNLPFSIHNIAGAIDASILSLVY